MSNFLCLFNLFTSALVLGAFLILQLKVLRKIQVRKFSYIEWWNVSSLRRFSLMSNDQFLLLFKGEICDRLIIFSQLRVLLS